MLEAVGLTRTVRDRALLDAVSFAIPRGTTATVLGPSGSGKTTLLRTVMGLERPDAGRLLLDGRCLAGDGREVPPERRGIALLFQEFTLFPHLDVAANLAFGLADPRGERARCDALLELLEIAHLRRRRIDRLSGGEQQRVALARALAVRPRVLLLDEPFSNVDGLLRERLQARLRAHLAEQGVTALIATHDRREAFYFSDAILLLKEGRLRDHGPPRRVYERPADAWVAAFLGDANFPSGRELAPLAPHRELRPEARYLVRPESLALAPARPGVPAAAVRSVVYYGTYQDVELLLDGGPALRAHHAGSPPLAAGERVGVRLRDGVEPHAVEGAA